MTLDLDPERRLALAYVPTSRRAAVEALWRLDVALASVLATGREPMVSRIRLAWWREALERLDRAPPPAEPVLEALSARVLPAGVTGAGLAAMTDAWEPLLSPDPLSEGDLREYAARRGRLFALTAQLLGGGEADGEGWALIDFARHSSNQAEAARALELARAVAMPVRWPRPLRPLGMLAVLARRDAGLGLPLEPAGSPARMMRMVRHRLTGD